MVLILRRDEVEACLRREPRYEGALALLETTFRELGVHNRVVSYREERTRLRYPPDAEQDRVEKDLWIMPMYVPGIGCAAMRIGSRDDSIIALYDFQYMGLQGIVQDRPLEGLRAGLPLALACKWLGARDGAMVGCIGAGSGAEAALSALAAVCQPARVTIRGRDDARGDILAGRLGADLGVDVRSAASVEEAVRGADVVLIAPEEPGRGRLRHAWVAPGALIATADPDAIAPETLARATVVHASRQHAPAWAAADGAVVDLGDVMRREHSGRTRQEEVMVFVSPPGMGFCDVATAWWCHGVAQQHGLGIEVPLVSREPLDGDTGL